MALQYKNVGKWKTELKTAFLKCLYIHNIGHINKDAKCLQWMFTYDMFPTTSKPLKHNVQFIFLCTIISLVAHAAYLVSCDLTTTLMLFSPFIIAQAAANMAWGRSQCFVLYYIQYLPHWGFVDTDLLRDTFFHVRPGRRDDLSSVSWQ